MLNAICSDSLGWRIAKVKWQRLWIIITIVARQQLVAERSYSEQYSVQRTRQKQHRLTANYSCHSVGGVRKFADCDWLSALISYRHKRRRNLRCPGFGQRFVIVLFRKRIGRSWISPSSVSQWNKMGFLAAVVQCISCGAHYAPSVPHFSLNCSFAHHYHHRQNRWQRFVIYSPFENAPPLSIRKKIASAIVESLLADEIATKTFTHQSSPVPDMELKQRNPSRDRRPDIFI